MNVTDILLLLAVLFSGVCFGLLEYSTRKNSKQRKFSDQQAFRIAQRIANCRDNKTLVYLHALFLALPGAVTEVKSALDKLEDDEDVVKRMLGSKTGKKE